MRERDVVVFVGFIDVLGNDIGEDIFWKAEENRRAGESLRVSTWP